MFMTLCIPLLVSFSPCLIYIIIVSLNMHLLAHGIFPSSEASRILSLDARRVAVSGSHSGHCQLVIQMSRSGTVGQGSDRKSKQETIYLSLTG